jgi:effector-binding domain-containing protein
MNRIVEYLKEHNVEVASPLRELYGATGFGTSVYILDPDQYMIELKANYSQYPVKVTAAQARGNMTRPAAKQ